MAGQEGRFAEAATLLEEARGTYSALHLPRELADVLTNQGYVLMHIGDLAGARRHLRQAEHLFRQIGMHLDRARVLGGLGSLELRLGDTHAAVEHFATALEVYDAGGLGREVDGMLVNLGVAHAADEDWESAVQLQQAALEVYAELLSSSDGVAQAEHNLGVAFAGRGDHEAARDHYLRARAAYRRLGRRREAADVTVNLGNAAAAAGDLAAARRYHRRAIRDFRELGVWPPLARAVHNLGLTYPPASAARRERVLPAWLALDAVRFTLPDAAQRSRWRDTVGVPGAAAFDSAARHGPLLLAEVIEHARAVGTVDDAAPGPAVGLVDVPGLRNAPPIETGVRPPRPVDLGWPSVLSPYLERSRALRPTPAVPDPAASLVALLWAAVVPGSERVMVEPDVPTAWWLGFWRAGEHLYWWTTAVSPVGDRAGVRAAVRGRVTRPTWRQTVDPDRAAPGPVPAEAAFVAAGALAWSDVEPHLAALAAAVPVQVDPSARAEADDLARRLRRVTRGRGDDAAHPGRRGDRDADHRADRATVADRRAEPGARWTSR